MGARKIGEREGGRWKEKRKKNKKNLSNIKPGQKGNKIIERKIKEKRKRQ